MKNPFDLTGKKIVVTGASSGIGRQAAISISEMGGEVIINGRNTEELSKTFSLLKGKNHECYAADLTDETQLNELTAKISDLNGIVHCAGIVRPFPVKFITKKQIDEIYNINYISTVLLTSKLLKEKKINKAASLVFVSSISSRFAHKGGALYSASKAGLEIYSKTIAIEFATQKIRSNCIQAAMVKTPLFDTAEQAVTKEMMDAHGEKYPLGFGEPTDVANAIIFLLSDASKWITGTNLVMDGGLTAGH